MNGPGAKEKKFHVVWCLKLANGSYQEYERTWKNEKWFRGERRIYLISV